MYKNSIKKKNINQTNKCLCNEENTQLGARGNCALILI